MGSMTTDSAGRNLQWVDSSPASPPVGAGQILGNGLEVTGRSAYSTIPVGSVAYGSLGTNAVHVAGTVYYSELFIERNMTITNINVLNGATAGGTDKLIAAIYAADGTRLGTSALAGADTSGTDAFQVLALTAPINVTGPARYWIGVQCNGTSDKTRRIAASTHINCLAGSATGVFGTLPAITPPTTFTADKGPIAYVN